MKKLIALLMILSVLFIFAACSDSSQSSSGQEKVKETSPAASAASTESASSADDPGNSGSTGDIDIDLTAMSGTMVYSEVLNMQQNPADYMNKTVKIRGTFNVTKTDTNTYFACLIKDATACCSSGIEFVTKDDLKYPLDYPKPQSEITVTGTFTTYMEGKNRYLQLKDAELSY